jgi:branched-subunit amino acid aminotransferase/4-amino-4-deoxychorismate lyase
MAIAPSDSVFTTLPFDGVESALDPIWHFKRIRNHASRLGISIPKELLPLVIERLGDAVRCWRSDEVELGDTTSENKLGKIRLQPPALLQITVDCDGDVKLTIRTPARLFDSLEASAVTNPMPRFSRRITGTKHAAWQPYHDARKYAKSRGADVALLIDDDIIVDADRASPILLDSDGVAYFSRIESGAVDSLTLRALSDAVSDAGIPLRPARLTRTLVARCREFIVVGSGIGVARIVEIDGQFVGGDEPTPLYRALTESQDKRLESGWISLREVVAWDT